MTVAPTHVHLECRRVSKAFDAVTALDSVTLSVSSGTTHAILGDNGAGKTTLLRIIAGLANSDTGDIIINGVIATHLTLRARQRLGVSLLPQHIALVPELTVLENLTAGATNSGSWRLTRSGREQMVSALASFHLETYLDRKVSQLPYSIQKLVDLFRIVHSGSKLLLLDEPTATLGPASSEDLLRRIEALVAANRLAILVTHKLPEVRLFAGFVSVLRRGRVVLTGPTSAFSDEEIVQAMLGGPVSIHRGFDAPADPLLPEPQEAETVLEINDLTVYDDRSRAVLSSVSFSLRPATILGLIGAPGSGQEELAETICGMRPSHPEAIRRRLIGGQNWPLRYVPLDRLGVGAPGALRVYENATLRDFAVPPVRRGLFVDTSKRRRLAQDRIDAFAIRGTLDQRTDTLSGGNIQRLILARETSMSQAILVLHNPTSGLDIQAACFARSLLRDCRRRGWAIILIDDDMDSLLDLADDIMVISEGQALPAMRRSDVTRSTLGHSLSGVSAIR